MKKIYNIFGMICIVFGMICVMSGCKEEAKVDTYNPNETVITENVLTEEILWENVLVESWD